MTQIFPKQRRVPRQDNLWRYMLFLVAFVTNAMKRARGFHQERPRMPFRPGMAAAAALVILFSVLTAIRAEASHFRYGNITWSRPDAASRTITITLTQSYRMSNWPGVAVGSTISDGVFLNFGDNSNAQVSLKVNSVNVAEDYFIGTFTTTHTYASSGDFNVSYSNCCRLSTLQNNADGNFGQVTSVNLSTSNLGSPVSTLPPVVSVSTGLPNATFNVPAADPDGGALTYALSASVDFGGGIQAPGISINSATGAATFNTVGKAVGTLWSAAFTITDATGSRSVVDFLVKIVGSSNPPVFDYAVTPLNNAVYNVHPGDNIAFAVAASDPDVGSTVLLNGAGLPTGATFSPSGTPTPSPSTNFSWTPTAAQLGTYVMTFVATDDVGVQTSTTVRINVTAGPQFLAPTPPAVPDRLLLTGATLNDVIKASNPDPTVTTRILSASVPTGVTLSPSLPTALTTTPQVNVGWTPVVGQWGDHAFSFVAEDQNNNTATRTYHVVVNTKPQFTSSPIVSAVACQPYSYTITGTDVDLPYGDELEFEAHSVLPSWLTLTNNPDGTATLSGTPGAGDVGSYAIELVAADIYHHSSTLVEQPFTIVVSAATPVAVTNGGNICAGNNAVFNLTGPAGYVVNYTLNGTAASAALSGSGTASLIIGGATANQVLNLVSVTNPANSCTRSLNGSSSVTINPVPTGSASAQAICSGAATNVALSASLPGTTFTWTAALQSGTATGFSDCSTGCGTVIAQTLTNTTTVPAVVRYTVTPSSSLGCPGTVFTVDVTVNPIPTGTAVAQTICSGAATNVALNSNVSGTTFAWTAALQSGMVTGFNNCSTGCGNAIAQTLTNGSAGSGIIRYTVTPSFASCAGTPFAVDVTVNAIPVAQAGADKMICSTGEALDAAPGVAPQTGAWSIIGGPSTALSQFASLTDAHAVFTPAVAGGSYSLKWTLSNNACASSADTVLIASLGAVQGTITASSNANVCSGQTSNINISVNPVSGGTFSGTFTNGKTFSGLTPNAGIISPSYSFTNNGTTNTTESFVLSSLVFHPNSGTLPTPGICNATAQAMGGQTLVTIQPVADLDAIAAGPVCNGGNVSISISNPNAVGGTYNRTAAYNGAGHTAATSASGMSYLTNGSFTETLTNNTNAPINVVYTFTPVSPGSQGCVGGAKTITVTVNPTPNVVAVADQQVCNNAPTAAVNFSGGVNGTVFEWINDNTAIGLAASGTGDIPSFNGINNGTTPVNAHIRVTTKANGCSGASDTFAITVKPTPSVLATADQNSCNGANTTAVSFSGPVSGTVLNWTNNTPSIGLAASGSGNIASFNGVNSGNVPVTAAIRVSPLADGCTGAADTFMVTIKPTPSVVATSDATLCNGVATAAVSFNGPVAGSVFHWTNDELSIGLAASGNGDIASFNASNSGTASLTAHIRVVPSADGCTGAADTFAITVNPTPAVVATSDQSICNGAAITAVSFAGNVAGTVFEWTNDNPAIGLAASGTGTIAAFNGINNGTAPVSAHMRILPKANSCTGAADTFIITVKPTPHVAATADQAICNGAATTAVHFNSAVSGAVFHWTNDNVAIGLAASGTGDIASFNAINNNAGMAQGRIVVTPVADGCDGPSDTFMIAVKPTPTVVATTDQIVCNGSPASISFSGAVSGTVFNWTNDQPSIGLAANGKGNMSAFNAINNGTTAIVANVRIVPEADGCTGTADTFTITVNPSPAFTFNVNGQAVANGATDKICQATSTTFAISGATPGHTFSMLFNGASYATGTVDANGSFSHTFVSGGTPTNTTAGTYELTLTDNVTHCTATKTYHIYVNPKPTDSFVVNGIVLATGQTATHCEGSPLQLAVTGDASHTYVISKGGNTLASGTVNGPAYAINAAALNDAGTYTVALTNIATGCTASRTYELAINPLPQYILTVNNAALADNATTTHCAGTPVTLALTGDASSSYTLSHNGSPVASGHLNDPAYTFTAATTDAGTYQLAVTTAAGCARSSSYSMMINTAPAFLAVPGNQLAQTVTGTCAAPVTYTGPVTDGVPSPTVAYALSGATTGSGSGDASGLVFNKGVTTVTLTATNICSSKDSSFTVTVEDAELPVFTACPVNLTAFSATNDCGNDVPTTTPAYTDNCTLGANPLSWTMSGATLASGNGAIGTHHFNVGITNVTYTVTDASGNHNTCSYTVTVSDNVFPTISCAGNITQGNDAGACGAIVNFNAPVAHDNCSGYTVSQSAGLPSGSLFPLGNTTNTFVITDAAGNTASCSFTVTVNDVQAPVLTAPAAQTLNVGAGNNCQVPMPDYRNLFMVNENCGGTVTLEQLAPNQPGSLVIGYGGTRTIKVKATDIAGNYRVDSFTLNLVDGTAPVTICKNITVNLNAAGTATITPSMIDNNSHDNCSAITLAASKLSFDCSNVGQNVVTLTATDASGNNATCNATVTVMDITAPALSCWSDTTMEKGPLCTAEIPDLTYRVTATDACGVATVTQSPVAGTIIAAFTQSVPVTLTVTDIHGNAAQCSFNVNFADHSKPAIVSFPADIVVNNGADSCGKRVSWTAPVATDNCGVLGAVHFTSTHTPGSVFPVGTTKVTYTATDQAGNDSVRSFIVTVTDAQAPKIAGCPATIHVGTDAQATTCSATATWIEPTATDNCTSSGSLVWTKSHHPGDVFPVGTTTVTYTATDEHGNVSTACSFDVVVADQTLPVLAGCPAALTVYTGAAATGCEAAATWTEPTATDNCTPSANLVWTKNHHPGDVFPVGVTTVTYTAADAAGNVSATCSFDVTVIDNTIPQLSNCPATVQVNTGNSATPCSAVATWAEPVATDNCTPSGNLVWTKSHQPGDVFPVGMTMVTYTATDASGNVSATCTFNVVVTDNTAPVIAGCPSAVQVNTGAGATGCEAIASWTEPTATDNCTPAANLVWNKSHQPGDLFPVGTTTVTYTATDAAGNVSATCSFDVTVTDNTAPVFSNCPASMTNVVTNNAGCTAEIVTTVPAVTDNCNMSTLTWTLSGATSGTSAASGINYLGTHIFEVGTTTVTYTATDAAGNTQTCSYNIEVVNRLAGYISGTSTVAQNLNTTSNITFAASGGKAPYTFTYSVNNGPAQTISTTGANTVTTVPQSNAVLGAYAYTLLSVQDANGCTGTLQADNKDTITVVVAVPRANLAPTITIPVPSFTSSNTSRPYTINLFNVAAVPSSGNITLYVLKPTATGSSMTFSNTDWTVTEAPSYYILESPATINGNFGFSSIQGTIQLAPAVANGTYSVQVILGPGSGGDDSPENNSASGILNKTN
ncbi:HYR domain-containing protein [Taibaiella koreensis]|uniref:HYR domain-containing protein n=1 Tax=Taibaiella koreensis TaxID=1268548 RepID=UPI000E59D8F9|nr:HYR domain-containing protein [Taibaiella koreensis]